MSDSNRSSAPRTQHAALTPHSQVTDGIWTRIWRFHKPLHSLFCHSHSIPGTTRTRIRWLEATQSCPIDLRRHIKWSTAGFDPASSACKADVLPNELRPQSCRDPIRTCMIHHMSALYSLCPFCITKIHDPFISGFEPYYKFPTFAFATEIIAVRATSLTFRTLYSEQDFWIMWAVICFCCKCPVFHAPLTPHSQQPQRESNPRLRSDSPVYWPLYYGAIYSSCFRA